jgi:hypothetical protein
VAHGREVHSPYTLRPQLQGGEDGTTRDSEIDFNNGFIRIRSIRTQTRHFRAAQVSRAALQAVIESCSQA